MLLMEQDVNQILAKAESSGVSLRQLYRLYRKQTRKWSLAFICRKAGIPSKGYLSLVMTGERRLHEKYWESVCTAFKLNQTQSELMQLLLKRDALPARLGHSNGCKPLSREELHAEPRV